MRVERDRRRELRRVRNKREGEGSGQRHGERRWRVGELIEGLIQMH